MPITQQFKKVEEVMKSYGEPKRGEPFPDSPVEFLSHTSKDWSLRLPTELHLITAIIV